MAKKELPDPEVLRKLLRYEPETGKLFWRARTPEFFRHTHGKRTRTPEHTCNNWNSRHAGKETFTQDDGHGYCTGGIFNRPYRAHRVIWAIVHGEWPSDHMDHINGNRRDNRIENLRVVTVAENNKNLKTFKTNKSGRMGVHFDKSCRRWRAYIRYNGKRRHIGLYGSFEEASKARAKAEIKYGYHPNHGRKT